MHGADPVIFPFSSMLDGRHLYRRVRTARPSRIELGQAHCFSRCSIVSATSGSQAAA